MVHKSISIRRIRPRVYSNKFLITASPLVSEQTEGQEDLSQSAALNNDTEPELQQIQDTEVQAEANAGVDSEVEALQETQDSVPQVRPRRYSLLQEDYFRWSSSFISLQVRKAPVQKKQVNIMEQVELVAEVLPRIPREVIMRNLRSTNSVPQTIESLLQSRWDQPTQSPLYSYPEGPTRNFRPNPLGRTYSGNNFHHVAVA